MSSSSSKGVSFLFLLLLLGVAGAGGWELRNHQARDAAAQVAVDYTKAMLADDKETLKRVATPELQEQIESTSGLRGFTKALFGSSSIKLEGVAGVDLMADGSATVWVDVRTGKRLRRSGVIVVKTDAGAWRVAGRVGS